MLDVPCMRVAGLTTELGWDLELAATSSQTGPILAADVRVHVCLRLKCGSCLHSRVQLAGLFTVIRVRARRCVACRTSTKWSCGAPCVSAARGRSYLLHCSRGPSGHFLASNSSNSRNSSSNREPCLQQCPRPCRPSNPISAPGSHGTFLHQTLRSSQPCQPRRRRSSRVTQRALPQWPPLQTGRSSTAIQSVLLLWLHHQTGCSSTSSQAVSGLGKRQVEGAARPNPQQRCR